MPRGEARRLGADVCRGLAGLPRGRRGRGAVWLGGDGAVGWRLRRRRGQLLLGLLLRGRFAEDAEPLPALPEREREAPVRAAVGSVLQVCGYMALFSVAAAMAAKLLGGAAGDLLLYIADMPSAWPARRKRARPGRCGRGGGVWRPVHRGAEHGRASPTGRALAGLSRRARLCRRRLRARAAIALSRPRRRSGHGAVGDGRTGRRPRWRRCCCFCRRCWPWPVTATHAREKNQTLNKPKLLAKARQKGPKTAIYWGFSGCRGEDIVVWGLKKRGLTTGVKADIIAYAA